MKHKLLLTIALLCCGAFLANAQSRTVTGNVTSSEDGTPIPGVNVVVKGTTIGTITDIDGNYAIQIDSDESILVFSYIGLNTEEVLAGARSVVDLSMSPDLKQLNEVVVVAYGTQSKQALTGAIGVVDKDVIKNQQIVSVGQALQGTTPGVNVITGSGQPGTKPTIRIRGVSSYGADATPLTVLDGVVFNGDLSSISPGEIESINVLKDASASALYGSRAANGVLIITTKSGNNTGKAKIDFGASYGFSSRAVPEYDFLNAEEYMKLGWEALRFEGEDIGEADPGQYASDNLIDNLKYNPYGIDNPIDAQGNLVNGAELLWETDWEKELSRDQAARQDYNLSFTGGNEKTQYFIYGGYINQEGQVITSKFERINTRLNLETKVNDWLKVGTRSSFSYSDQNFPNQEGTAYANNIQYIRTMSSIYPVYKRDDNGALILDEEGNPEYDFGESEQGRLVNVNRPVLKPSNLVATTYLNDVRRQRYYSNLNGYIDITFLKDFSLKSNFSYELYLFDRFDYDNPDNGDGENVGGRVRRQKNITNAWTWYNQLTYDKTFGKHYINASIISEAYNYRYEYLNAQKTGFPFGGLKEFNSAASNENISGYTNQHRMLSSLGRVSYNYDGRYYAEFAIRGDESSKFSSDNRLGTFTSYGGSWVASNEGFFSSLGVISLLKIRASYGELGNNKILDSDDLEVYFPYISAFETGYDDLDNSGVFFNYLANNTISWEKVNSTNIGIDFGLFDDRLSGSVEWYEKNTTGMLFDRPLTRSVGYPRVQENNGDMRNTGVEVMLNSVNIQSDNFTWNTGFNISFEKNEITKLNQEEIIDGSKRLKVGSSVYNFYIEEWAGVDPEDGAAMWYMDELDEEGNVIGKVTTKDYSEASRYDMGSALPNVRWGFSSNMQFHGFDFSFLVAASHGGKVLDYDYAGLMHGFNRMGYQLHSDVLDRWQEPGDETNVPRLNTGNSSVSSRSSNYLFDNSYIRLRNVTLGYSLSPSIFENSNVFRSLRVYVQADNYWTWSQRPGLDPEVNIEGTTDNRSAMFKTMSFGVNLGF
jgi:TonB-linked SusC/RagA family outer membrane protein